jgi:hypothetical protein
MEVVQRTKVRPILNLSTPLGRSFKDAVQPERVDKLKMSSAKLFADINQSGEKCHDHKIGYKGRLQTDS